MKMRGYSVLFVCALCVFVLCGAAAAVALAQDETPEKVAVKAARDRADTAAAEGYEALGIHKEFGSDLPSVASNLTLIVGKITASKIQAGEIKRTEDQKKEQILWEIDKLKIKAEAAVEALRDVETWTLKNEQTKAALTSVMEEVDELYMAVMEKAAAAVTGNIYAVDAVIEKAGALETATDKAWYMWNDAFYDLDARLSSAVAAVKAVNTTITATEGFLNLFNGSSDLEAQKVNKELSDAVKNELKPSLEKLMSLRDALENATEAARGTSDQYYELKVKAGMLKQAAEEWKKRAASVKALKTAKDDADTAKADGDEALDIDKRFASDVSSVASSLTLAVRKIAISKIPAGKIMQEIKDIKKERILRELDGLKTKVEAATAALEPLKDVEAATLKDEQTKRELTERMKKEIELNMTVMEKAAAAVTGNISAIDVLIEKAGALETEASEASGLWKGAVQEYDGQFFNAVAAVSAVESTITATESFLNLFNGSSDFEAQKVSKELSDAVKNTLRPSLEKLLSLRDAFKKAKLAALETSDQYDKLKEIAKKLKEAAEEWRRDLQKVSQEGGQVSPDPPPSAAN